MLPLSPEYWRHLESLFHAATQMDAAARAEYLAQVCGDDDDLREKVEEMIRSIDEPDHLIDAVISREAEAAVEAERGERIGQYEIVRELGHGGMGTVYLAVRADDQFRKQVAIKLMRGDLMGRPGAERFRVERQILANLEHPGIARLLDGGTTLFGSPYVVMEYVDGVPVDTYCDQRQLSVRERIALFYRVADAVSYAHRNLVVHRDIKPENVLVTAQGDPKLLDFGIAKLLTAEGAEAGDGQALTIAAERLMTPEYASPEQARGDAMTTLSDVYSLGVLLYKMLTGRVPVRITSVRAAEIEREICGTAPPAASVAAGRSAAWLKLGRESVHDLDTILQVALHKEPGRRYASVENFAADLRRFLDGFPVLACGDSWSYRTGKMLRRHPLVATSATLVLGLIILFAVAMTVLAKRARDEARTANEVTDFLVSVFQANDPSSGRGDQVTARELLDRGAVQLDTRLKEDPMVQARLFDTMGALYTDLGSPEKAEELLQRSLKVRRERLSLTDDAAADTLDNLGDLALDRSLYGEAEQYYRQALAIHLKREPGGTRVAQDEARLSSVFWNMGRFPEAEELDRKAIAMQIKLAGEDDLTTLEMQNDLGTIFQSEGRYAEAAAQARRVLDRRLRVEPPNHPDLGYSWHNYSQPLAGLGRYAESLAAERQALAVRRAAYGENHPQVALTEGELAALLVQMGQFDEALGMARHALELEMKAYGRENRDTSFAMANYAKALLGEGEGSAAREQAEQAMEARSKVFPAGHPKVADGLAMLGEIDFALGNRRAAEQELRSAIAMRRAAYGPTHGLVGSGERELAEVLVEGGSLTEAERMATDALAIERASYPAGHPEVGMAESTLGWVELQEGRVEAAMPLLLDGFAQVSHAYGPQHPLTASLGMRVARAKALRGDVPGAMQLAGAAVPILMETKDPEFRQGRAMAVKVQRMGVSGLLR